MYERHDFGITRQENRLVQFVNNARRASDLAGRTIQHLRQP